jgi:uncharacterized protein
VSLQKRIQSDLTAAMRERDRARVSALRLVIAEVKNAAVDKGVGAGGELEDEEVERILQREVKRRREAATSFRDAGREDRAAENEAEAEIYAAYLPEPLDDDELLDIAQQAIADVGAEGPQDMGAVMAKVMPQVGGRADGRRVSALVKSLLMD